MRLLLAFTCTLVLLGASLHAQVPQLLNYQGRVVVGTTNFNSPPNGLFKFALVNAAGTTTYWRNSPDTTPADGVPDLSVALTVTKGLYSVLLGDTSITNMAAIPASVWANPDVRLRVWFNDGTNDNQLLTPDQRLAPNGYHPDGSISSAALASGAVTSAKLASGLTLGGTTTGTFSGNLSGNAATAGSATNFTGNLAGNVTGPQAATVVATVGGATASNVAAGANLANAATNANTANTIVKRDASGNFSAGTISGTLSGNATTATTATSATTAGSATNFTGNLAGNVTGPQGATVVASVGGVTASNVAAGANLANAATSASISNAIVKRGANGTFSAGSINASSGGGVAALIGVEGGVSPGVFNTGVYGESVSTGGNGVVGVANNGTNAYAIWGQSTSGYAGMFGGRVSVADTVGLSPSTPVLEVSAVPEVQIGLRSTSSSGRLWTIQSSGTYGNPALDGTFQIIDRTPGGSGLVGLKILPSGTVSVKVLKIDGADVAEPFHIATEDAPKGAVVVIDEEKPGRLKVSDHAYDRRVAGILSGANGIRAGICLSQEGFNEGGRDVSLSGRVYVQADASNGAIHPGDMLTTSDLPGHAMKVTDHERSQGAVLGKAMSSLEEGTGMVLVLVTLQ